MTTTTQRSDPRGGAHAELRRPADEPEWRGRRGDRGTNLHGFVTRPRRLLLTIAEAAVWVQPGALPLENGALGSLDVAGTLEHVRDDEALYDELARVLRPGGRLRLRVPHAGRLAGIDALNLYAYAADIARRGPRAPESEELKFRRHLGLAEVAEALGPERFIVDLASTRGLGVSEGMRVAALIGTAIATNRAGAWLALRPALERLERLERRLPLGSWWLEVTATRR